MKKFFLPLVAICLMASCSSSVSCTFRTARSTDVPVEMRAQWTTADLQVSEDKVSFTMDVEQGVMMSADKIRENAIGLLLEKHNADVLINPLFTYDYIDNRLTSVTVSGYPARHTNFRNISFEEQQKFLIEKEKAQNAPQMVINGGEIRNEVVNPAPKACEKDATAASESQPQAKEQVKNRRK
ncbi:MAG: hypothetical protein IJS00_04990 [Paludibacteraceae bacterium]|nr:hypothetical protein [Paludibacteraceae bacterium]